MDRNHGVPQHRIVEHLFCRQSVLDRGSRSAQLRPRQLHFTQPFKRKFPVRSRADQIIVTLAILNLVQIAIVAAILRLSQQSPVSYCRQKAKVTLVAGLDVGQETGHPLVVISAIVSLLSDRRCGSNFIYP